MLAPPKDFNAVDDSILRLKSKVRGDSRCFRRRKTERFFIDSKKARIVVESTFERGIARARAVLDFFVRPRQFFIQDVFINGDLHIRFENVREIRFGNA